MSKSRFEPPQTASIPSSVEPSVGPSEDWKTVVGEFQAKLESLQAFRERAEQFLFDPRGEFQRLQMTLRNIANRVSTGDIGDRNQRETAQILQQLQQLQAAVHTILNRR